MFGALFTSGLGHNLARDLPADVAGRLADAGGGSIQAVAELPAAQQVTYKSASADALTTVFTYALPIMVVAFLLKQIPLRSSTHSADDTARELSPPAPTPPHVPTPAPGAAR